MEIPGRKPSSRHATAKSGQADLGKRAWWCVVKKEKGKKKEKARQARHTLSLCLLSRSKTSLAPWFGPEGEVSGGGGGRDVLSDCDPAAARKSACRGLFLPSMPLLQIARSHN